MHSSKKLFFFFFDPTLGTHEYRKCTNADDLIKKKRSANRAVFRVEGARAVPRSGMTHVLGLHTLLTVFHLIVLYIWPEAFAYKYLLYLWLSASVKYAMARSDVYKKNVLWCRCMNETVANCYRFYLEFHQNVIIPYMHVRYQLEMSKCCNVTLFPSMRCSLSQLVWARGGIHPGLVHQAIATWQT